MLIEISYIATISLFFFIILSWLGFLIPLKENRYKNKPPVSVIVAVWNEGSRISKCIDSLLKLDYPKKEIIVVGGGEDNTKDVCTALAKNKKIKYLIERKRRGKWYSLNKAIENAKYDLVAFTDADCVVTQNWLNKLVSNLGNGDIVISPFSSLIERTSVAKMYSILYIFVHFLQIGLLHIFQFPTFFGHGSIAKKSIFQKIKFKNNYIEDFIFSSDALKEGFKIAIINEWLVFESPPVYLNGLRECWLRLFQKPVSMIFIFFSGILFIYECGIIYNLFRQNYLVFVLYLIPLIASVITLILISYEKKTVKYILFFPYLILSILYLQFVVIEGIIRLLISRHIGWPIYEKLDH